MSAAKHTPGPWLLRTEGYPRPDVRAVGGRAVACTWMVCNSTPKTAAGYQARCEEDRANARLIAAAPELFALVQRLALLTDEGDDQIKGAAYIDKAGTIRAKGSLLEAIEQARAAIAKAEGAAK